MMSNDQEFNIVSPNDSTSQQPAQGDQEFNIVSPDNNSQKLPKGVTPEIVAERTRNSNGLQRVDATVRGLANALPFMSDIAAAGDTATSYLPQSGKQYIPGIPQDDQSNKSFSERYSENLAHERGIDTFEASQHPIETYGGQIAGSLA